MNVACPQCPAKYAVTDDKVRGRKVRIKCKRCGSPIIVDGTQLDKGAAAFPAVAAKDQLRPRQKTMMGGLQAPDLLKSATAGKPGPAAAREDSRVPVSAPSPSFKPISVGASKPAESVPRLISDKAPFSAPEQSTSQRGNLTWSVAISETDVREMSSDEIVAAFITNVIDQYTYIWRDTMSEWLAPFDVLEIATLLRARGITPQLGETPSSLVPRSDQESQDSEANREWRELLSKSTEEPQHPPGAPKFDDVTVVMTQEQIEAAHDSLSSLQMQRGEFQALEVTPTDHNVSWPPEPPEAEPAVDAPPQAAPAVDAAPQVAPEESAVEQFNGEPPSSLEEPSFKSEPPDSLEEPTREQFGSEPPDSGLTGARNESSVLFSLRAMVQAEESQERVSEDSFIADHGQAPELGESALVQAVSQPPSAIPIGVISSPATPKSKGNGKLWLALGGLLVLAAAGVAYFVLGPRGPQPSIAQESISGAAQPTATSAHATIPTSEPVKQSPPPPTQPVSAIPSAATAPTAAPGIAVPTAAASSALGASSSGNGSQPQAPAPRATAPSETVPPPTPHGEPTPSAEPEPAALGPFNTDAAKNALATAAASASIDCKVPNGPKGSGKVTVTFAPSGRSTQALVSGDFAGTTTGGCIARVFKDTHVPPFSGTAVSVSKSITIR